MRTAREITQDLHIAPPGRFVRHPEEWAAQQAARLTHDVGESIATLATKTQDALFRAERAEGHVQVLQARLRDLERAMATLGREHSALRDQVRQVDLSTVLRDLGATPDWRDVSTWRTAEGYRLSVEGQTCVDRTTGWEGRGALSLVMYIQGYSTGEALGYLRETYGPTAALNALTQHTADERQHMVEMAPAPPEQPERSRERDRGDDRGR